MLSSTQFCHPRYWATWLAFGLLWLVTRLPCLSWQLAIGRGIGKILYRTMKRRRHITRCNIAACYPQKSIQEQQQLVKACFESMGMGLVELAMSWWIPKRKLTALIRLENFANIEHLFGQAPVLILGAHMMSMDLAAKCMPEHYHYAVIYRPAKNKLFDAYLLKKRQQIFSDVIARDDAKKILKTLKNKTPVWLAPDQDYGAKRSVFADFFNIPTATITSVSRLAAITKATVIPIFHYRNITCDGYRVVAYPPLANFPSADPIADAKRINQAIEQAIAYDPSQYIWQHRRFKTRPTGQPSLYETH